MLKRLLFLSMLLPVLAVLPGTSAEAADVNIAGKVIAGACTINPVLASGQNVDLGTLGRTKFQHANDTGDWKTFSLGLTNCPVATTKVTTSFTGTPNSEDATLFANTEPAASAASNIAIQLAQASNYSAVLSNNSSMTVYVDTGTSSAVFPLAARLYTPTGSVQAGLVSGSVLVSFTYE